MPKNIVVFSDGTGQEGGIGNNTNVYKLFNMIVDRDDFSQVAFYDPGLGTGWNKITGNMFGLGISRNIKQCYRFLYDNYSVGDQIYLFGFSRGATTVRSLSGFIHSFGLLPKSRPELIDQAWDIYRLDNRIKMQQKASEFIHRHHTMWVRIHFLGVWDTVRALGIPLPFWGALVNRFSWWKHKFHDLRLSESVEHARHALAIDDRRTVFHPTLFDEVTKDYQTLKQVWFPGVHTDVGGGYKEQELSDIALEWMVGEARSKGLKIYPKHQVDITAKSKGLMHDSLDAWWKPIAYGVRERQWDSSLGQPVVHKSVRERNEADSSYSPWILQSDYRVEGQLEKAANA